MRIRNLFETLFLLERTEKTSNKHLGKTLNIKQILTIIKYGFCKKSLRKNETLTSCPFFFIFYHFWLGATANPTKSDKKDEKKGQLVRVSFFRSDFLQNPYFSCFWIWFAGIHLWIQQTKRLQCRSGKLASSGLGSLAHWPMVRSPWRDKKSLRKGRP